METILIFFTVIIFVPLSFFMMAFGIKTIKERRIDVKLLKILFSTSPDLTPEQSYKLLYPKEVIGKKLAEFYSRYYKISERRVIFFGSVMIFFGVIIFLLIFSAIFLKH